MSETHLLNPTEIKKELYKSKTIARFSHYVSGALYYTFELESGIFQFPIHTVTQERNPLHEHWDALGATYDPGKPEDGVIHKLSEDLGITPFCAEIKASELNRWIAKAIEKNEVVKIK